MKGKGRVYAVVGDLMEWFEREWKNRQALWLGLTVLISELAGTAFGFLERY